MLRRSRTAEPGGGPSADRRAAPLRVLTSLPGRRATTNPYLLQLVDALRERPERVHVDHFTWRRVLLGRYDVFHVHWPELLLRGSSRLRTASRRVRFLALLIGLRLRPTALVRTLHNVAAHERGDRVEGTMLEAFDRRTDLWIRLNPYTPVPDGAAERTILHGHYRDWFGPSPVQDPDPGRILFFGLLRAYKGVEELLAAFEELHERACSLRLVGHAEDGPLRRAVSDAVRRDTRISASIAYVSDEALRAEVAGARLVALPYRGVHNSGAALLALSLGRRVLMPRTTTTEWLQREVGGRWVVLYEGPLSAHVLRAALEDAPTDGTPDLQGRDWGPIAEAHIEAFEAAAALRAGQSRRYSR